MMCKALSPLGEMRLDIRWRAHQAKDVDVASQLVGRRHGIAPSEVLSPAEN